MTLVLFDFDGTLTTKDSLNEFLKYSVGFKKYCVKMLLFLPIFLLYKLKLMKNNVSKQILFKIFFKDYDENKFKTIANSYSLNKIDLILKKDVYKIFRTHIENKHRVIIVSASIECWLKKWCEKEGVELLSTQLEFKNHKVTGNFKTPNCYGLEKVNRIKQHLNIDEYDTIYAYGDSSGDDEMLNIADISKKY